jgi:hypothetical protein
MHSVPSHRDPRGRRGGVLASDGRDEEGTHERLKAPLRARLEALAEPNGICISRMVRDQIRDKLPYSFEDRGEQQVENIADSGRCAVEDDGYPMQRPGAEPSQAATKHTSPLFFMPDWSGARRRVLAKKRRPHLLVPRAGMNPRADLQDGCP